MATSLPRMWPLVFRVPKVGDLELLFNHFGFYASTVYTDFGQLLCLQRHPSKYLWTSCVRLLTLDQRLRIPPGANFRPGPAGHGTSDEMLCHNDPQCLNPDVSVFLSTFKSSKISKDSHIFTSENSKLVISITAYLKSGHMLSPSEKCSLTNQRFHSLRK